MLLHVSWVLDRSANTLLQTLLNQYHKELGYEFFKAKSISGFTERRTKLYSQLISQDTCVAHRVHFPVFISTQH